MYGWRRPSPRGEHSVPASERGGDSPTGLGVASGTPVMPKRAPTIRTADLPLLIGQIVENLPSMVFVKDARDLRFVLWNKAGEEIVGRSREELLGKNDYDFFPREQAEFFTAKDRQVLASGEVLVIEEEPIETPTGRRWLRTKKVPLCGEDGVPQYLLGISEDITERRQIERMKDDLVSIASHELRSPTVAVLGALSLLKDAAGDVLGEDAKHLLQLGEEEGQRMLDVVESCLDLAQLEDDRANLDIRNVDLAAALEEAVRLNQPFASQLDVRVRVGDVPSGIQVRADPQRLMQVLTNLISNAAKFSPEGEEVTVCAARRAAAVRIFVKDRGPGIPEEFEAQLYRKFSRARRAETASREGSGLGLSIVKALVDRMGGDIGFEPRTRDGTAFYIDLPAVPHA